MNGPNDSPSREVQFIDVTPKRLNFHSWCFYPELVSDGVDNDVDNHATDLVFDICGGQPSSGDPSLFIEPRRDAKEWKHVRRRDRDVGFAQCLQFVDPGGSTLFLVKPVHLFDPRQVFTSPP